MNILPTCAFTKTLGNFRCSSEHTMCVESGVCFKIVQFRAFRQSQYSLYLAKPRWRTVFAHTKNMYRPECFLLQNVHNSLVIEVCSKIKAIINNTALWNAVIILCCISFL